MNSLKMLLISILLVISLNAQEEINKGIKFEHGKWSEILTKADTQNKLIFLDAYASWCGPCKWMSKNVFTNDTIAEYFNATFVNAKIDMEKGEGLDIAKRYGVMNYPTMLYINGKGELIHRTCGSAPVSDFLQQGKDAVNPEKQLITLKKQFEAVPSNTIIAKRLFRMMQDGCMNIDNELQKYFANQKQSDLISRDNWELINQYNNDYKSREFKYVLKNQKKFAAIYTADSVEQKIKSVFRTGFRNQIRANNKKGISSRMKNSKEEKPVNEDKRHFITGILIYLAGSSVVSYAQNKIIPKKKSKIPVIKKYPVTPPGSNSIEEFKDSCTACHLCVSACPTQVLQPSFLEYGFTGILQPRMDYLKSFCNFDCTLCSDVCPTSAIKKISISEKKTKQLGKAIFIEKNCIVYTENTDCGACSEHCPTKAVSMISYKSKLFIPKVLDEYCIGCGACEYACPVKPYKAIYVDGNPIHLKAKKPEIKKIEKKIDYNEDFPF